MGKYILTFATHIFTWSFDAKQSIYLDAQAIADIVSKTSCKVPPPLPHLLEDGNHAAHSVTKRYRRHLKFSTLDPVCMWYISGTVCVPYTSLSCSSYF